MNLHQTVHSPIPVLVLEILWLKVKFKSQQEEQLRSGPGKMHSFVTAQNTTAQGFS